jgi:hypothetical protein
MIRDRRKNKDPNLDDAGKILNRKQLIALQECRYFGWKLSFIRRPLFQEPVPVLYNARIDQAGILDPDGHITTDLELPIRVSQSEPHPVQEPRGAPRSAGTMARQERPNHKVPDSDKSHKLLNQHQMRALRHIEAFGWRLYFVRRSLFNEPVAVIISPEGDRFATLEHDGQINMTPDTDLRRDAPVEKTVSAPFVPAPEARRA